MNGTLRSTGSTSLVGRARTEGDRTRNGPVEPAVARADLHCHSSASEVSRLGVQRALGLPECATPPEEVYALAKRRGMDFVTITDHDTIAGVLQIADRPDVFVSEELTAHFRGEPQAVHVLCYGISPDDHEWLQANRGDVEECAAYMADRDIVCALAHPYYTVGAPLTARHRRRLAAMFAIWEVRNGARARELNRPAAIYAAANDATGIGGSDDHAGVDVGRTFTETPPAATPAELLDHLRAGRAVARGAQGSAAKWAHAAIALAARSLGAGPEGDSAGGRGPDPRSVMRMAQRLLREGDVRHGAAGNDLDSDDARSLLRAWLAAVELDERDLIAIHAARALQPRRPPPPRLPRARAAAGRRRRGGRAGRRRRRTAGRRGGRHRRLRGLHRRDPLRPGRRLPGRREGQARQPRRRDSAGRRSWPTGSARRTASRARSRRSAGAVFRASRSR